MFARWMLALGVCMGCMAASTSAGEWPQFRGPGNAGVLDEAKLPDEWSAKKNVAWKVKVPGYGWSSPIVWGDKVFVTTAISDKQKKPSGGMGGFPGGPGGQGGGGFGAPPEPGQVLSPPVQERLQLSDEQKKQIEELQKSVDAGLDKILTDEQKKQFKEMNDGFGRGGPGRPGPGGFPGGFGGGKPPDAVYRWEIHCLDRATGQTLWKEVVAEKKPAIATHSSNTYASETPVSDGERVYAYFGMTGVYCYDFKGKKVWSKDLGAYKMQMGFGTGASPALDGDRLFIQCDNEEKSFLVALDKKNGDEIWRVDRNEKSSWSTPFVWKTKDRTQVVCCGGNKVRAYDPENGKLIWELGAGRSQFNATPVADQERLYLGAGGMMGQRPLVAIKAAATGDISLKNDESTNDGVAWWIAQAGPPMASPLLYRGYLYILDQNGGFLACYDAKTGDAAYKRQRLTGAKGFTSSPWAHDDKIFCLDQDGTTFVVQAGAKFKLLAKNTIEEMFWSSPALTGDSLILRGVDNLYCIQTKEK